MTAAQAPPGPVGSARTCALDCARRHARTPTVAPVRAHRLLIAALGRCVRLLRFLKGYKWNVEEAAAVVRASIKWREEYGVRYPRHARPVGNGVKNRAAREGDTCTE